MKSDEELFTALAVGEINCPCESGCRNAKRFEGSHASIDEIVECIGRYAWPLLIELKKAAGYTVPMTVKVLEDGFNHVNLGMSGQEAFLFEVRKYRMYACDSQKELLGLLASHPWEMFESIYRLMLDRSKAKMAQ